jgi:hypothetical protein
VKRILASAALTALAACNGGPRDRVELTLTANPSQVIATEIAFARMAREEGTWTAFREFATRDALTPSPGFVRIQDELRGVPDPAEPIVWGPDQVWSSCDGSFAVSTGGAVYPNGNTARFLTVWQKQSNGTYRWVLDQGFPGEEAEVSPDIIAAAVADCPPGPRSHWLDVRRSEAWGSGRSNDGTLAWSTELHADCSRTVVIRTLQGGEMAEVFRREAAAPAAAEGQPAPACG